MKAAVSNIYGGPEIIQMMDVAIPVPKDDEVLVKVLKSTVNRSDCGVLTGKPYLIRAFTGLTKPKRSIGGGDFSGEVTQIGSKVTKFQMGDIVFGFDDEGLQSHAEYLVISQDGNIAKAPLGVDLRDLVASLEGGHYALQDLKIAPVTPGMEVLVNGASGAIGSSLVQLYTLGGGIVTAIAHQENKSKIMTLGAKHFIDYTSQNVLDHDKQYDIILDTVGNISYLKAKKIMKSGGVYLSSELGPGRENIRYSIITKFFGSKKCKFALPSNIKASMDYFSDLLEQQKYTPLIDEHIYSLEDIASAYEYVMKGHKTGSVILVY